MSASDTLTRAVELARERTAERDEFAQALDAAIVGIQAAEAALKVIIAERDRARCTCIALEQIASRSFQLLWEGVGDQSSHGEEMEWGRKVAAFLRETSADAGPDRLPLPAGWQAS